MNWIYLILLIAITTSCCQLKPQRSFKYQNGVAITDSMHIYPIVRELRELDLDKPLPDDCIVYSSLYPTIHTDLKKTLLALEDSIYPYLEAKDEVDKRRLKDLRLEHDVLETGIVVIDNKTGQIISQYSSWSTKENDLVNRKTDLYGLGNTLLYTLAMSKKYTPWNEYPQLKQSSSLIIEPNVHRPFYLAFSIRPANFSYGLHTQFKRHEMKQLLHSLKWKNCSIEDSELIYQINGTLLDVTKTYTSFYNGGQLNIPTLIDSITDRKGKLIYKRKHKTTKTISKETAFEMLQILDYYTHFGIGAIVQNRYEEAPDYYGNFARSTFRNRNGWFMTIQKDYTIGIYCGTRIRNITCIQSPFQHESKLTVPLWLQTIESLNKYRAIPTKRHSSDLKRVFDFPRFSVEKEPVELPEIDI